MCNLIHIYTKLPNMFSTCKDNKQKGRYTYVFVTKNIISSEIVINSYLRRKICYEQLSRKFILLHEKYFYVHQQNDM